MTQLVIASRNPVKIGAVEGAYRRLFPEHPCAARGITVPSGVSDQPRGNDETLAGARQRALAAADEAPEADLWVGIEGGVQDEVGGAMSAFAWIVVVDRQGREGRARSASFFVPPAVAELVREGLELGEADDRIFSRRDSKREEGAVGILTRGVIDRLRLYEEAVVLALIPFRRPDLYPVVPKAAKTSRLREEATEAAP